MLTQKLKEDMMMDHQIANNNKRNPTKKKEMETVAAKCNNSKTHWREDDAKNTWTGRNYVW